MGAQPLRVELRRGVLFLTFDTPGSPVNVFTREAAGSLEEALRSVKQSGARAVVLASAKPRSFVNGVSLMLAGAVKSVEDAARLTRPIRAAYQALRRCPVPTVAAIRGNCYGCGIELTLQCRHRVVAETFDTHFYMTELADYLLIPTFGGTQDLPRLLGLAQATELVLWGPRWSARRAFESGLVDRCFTSDAFEQELERFVNEACAGKHAAWWERAGANAPEEIERTRRRTRRRIDALPPDYREVYGRCFDLMDRAAGKERLEETDYELESEASARSIQSPCSKAAVPFFFLRQMAKGLISRGAGPSDAIAFVTKDAELSPLCSEIVDRMGPGEPRAVRRVQLRPQGRAPREGTFVEDEIAVSTRLGAPLSSVALHAPLRRVGVDVIEVAGTSATKQALAATLADAYFTVLPTQPRSAFVLDDLVIAWLRPQLAYLEAGGQTENLASSLRAFGFARLVGDWLDAEADALLELVERRMPELPHPRRALETLPRSDCNEGQVDFAIVMALLVSLGGFAARALHERSIPHVVFADVAAREVVAFPLRCTSLCRHLTIARAEEALRAVAPFPWLVSAEDSSSLRQFVANGKEFYRGTA